MSVPYTRTATTLTVISNFRPVVIPSSHPNFKVLCDLVTKPETLDADIVPLLDIPAAIASFTGDEIKVVGGKLFYRGVEVKDNLAQVILGFVKSGDHTAALPFQRFLANCRANPDPKLVDTIYDWVVKANMPITPDGELIAWKLVQRDYKSKHAGKRGKLDHSIGNVVTEPREECDPNRNQTCSTGIHFASVEYIEKGSYGSIASGDRIIAVVINPEDITAIPTDYNLSKGRCCKLRVVGEIQRQDQMSGYYGSAKVYNGWAAASAAKPRTPRNSAGIAVGQVWAGRDGDQVTISSITAGGGYPVRSYGGRTYTEEGRFNGANSVSQLDLVRLIKDVD